MCRNFEENPIGEDDDWADRLAYNVKTDDAELDPNAPLFDPEKTQQGLDALDRMIPHNSLSGEVIDPYFRRFECMGKLRWLLDATQRNLTFNEKEFVFFTLWESLYQFWLPLNPSHHLHPQLALDLGQQVGAMNAYWRHNRHFRDVAQVIRDYGIYVNNYGVEECDEPHNRDVQIFLSPSNTDALQALEDISGHWGFEDSAQEVACVELRRLMLLSTQDLSSNDERGLYEELWHNFTSLSGLSSFVARENPEGSPSCVELHP